jgi:exocyst complex component 6
VRPRSRLIPWYTEVNFCTRVDSKDAEIERICGDNYQDFLSSLQTLTTIKTYTSDLRDTITRLDASVAQTGRGVVEKKRALLQSKRTAGNLDSAIDTLQACLRLLDVVARVGAMIQEGKYWSALRVCRFYIPHITDADQYNALFTFGSVS